MSNHNFSGGVQLFTASSVPTGTAGSGEGEGTGQPGRQTAPGHRVPEEHTPQALPDW